MATNKVAFALEVKTSVAPGAAVDCKAFDSTGRFQISGTFVATVQLEESTDGITYTVVGTALTAPGVVNAVPSPFAMWIRMNTTAYTSGTPTALGAAFFNG